MISDIGLTEALFGIGLAIAAFLFFVWIRLFIVNSRQPVRSIPVRVVSKRTHVGGGMNNMPASTQYFVTFENENGSRDEISVSGREFGMIAEGDQGAMLRQGTWYRGFRRSRRTSA